MVLTGLLFTACHKTDCWEEIPNCTMAPEPGLCQAAIPKFYYDSKSGTCKQFVWGGCGDYPFDTKEACEACKCKD